MEAKIDGLESVDKEVILTFAGDDTFCNDCVWIGAYKPQNSNDYLWNNSRDMVWEYFHEEAYNWEREE